MLNGRPRGFLTFALHAHLPYVVHHGAWPHGLQWLLESAAETCLPLLRLIRNLERDGLALKANLTLSPVLLEQLAHPVFRREMPRYLERKVLAAQEDESYFAQAGEEHFAQTAHFWFKFFQQNLQDFESIGGDIVTAFSACESRGLIEIITCAATHAYLPLLGTDESVRAQIMTGVATHTRHIGRPPRGIWIPECGYRPAGTWQMPLVPDCSSGPRAPFHRIGIEEVLGWAGLEYFFVDSHLVEDSFRSMPYAVQDDRLRGQDALYRPYYINGAPTFSRPVSIFSRDPKTSRQVWSSDAGYPGDDLYLDFHKKRWPGGHRYWQITHSTPQLSLMTPYHPELAASRTRHHAEHFVRIVEDALAPALNEDRPPILAAPFDAELFGHWWFEGFMWLENVVRLIAREDVPIALTTCSEYLDRYPPERSLTLREGSWGRNGTNEVWLNRDTAWTWQHIYRAEERVRQIAGEVRWRDGAIGQRIVQQLCRELMLLESSDWQFLITTEAAREYAESRFLTHLDRFRELENCWEEFIETGTLSDAAVDRLRGIEERDNIFAEIDPSLWAPADAEGVREQTTKAS